ncbi:unnamed protein product [Oppiella nova]|uniref:Tetraspanin n=1 Tax=Oppiella nova TaxID=334625 RepID=A0A7R9M1J8_9ACAR|nr:unnamed protein product [Oppiella nova]CAG2169062.1 unnamed protein product [Oppiella nova]
MVSGGMSCVKYLLFAFNLVFVIFGILLLYSGFKTIANIDHYHLLLDEAPHNVAIALVIVGFAIFAVAFLGCCGAIKENACMLTSFSSIILVILLIELIGAGLIFAFKSTLKSAAEKGIEGAIAKYNMTDNSTDINVILDDIQKNLKCCGAVNASDWQLHNKYPADTYPPSCCATETTAKFCTTDPYKNGCIDKLEADVKGSIGLLGGIAIAVAVIQLIGIIFSCSLSRSIKREYEVKLPLSLRVGVEGEGLSKGSVPGVGMMLDSGGGGGAVRAYAYLLPTCAMVCALACIPDRLCIRESAGSLCYSYGPAV